MAGINNLPPINSSDFFMPAIPVQFDMSAQILGGGSPLLPMQPMGELIPGFNAAQAGKAKPQSITDLLNISKTDLSKMGFELDKKSGMPKISKKAQSDYLNSIVGSFMASSKELAASFASFMGGPVA